MMICDNTRFHKLNAILHHCQQHITFSMHSIFRPFSGQFRQLLCNWRLFSAGAYSLLSSKLVWQSEAGSQWTGVHTRERWQPHWLSHQLTACRGGSYLPITQDMLVVSLLCWSFCCTSSATNELQQYTERRQQKKAYKATAWYSKTCIFEYTI